MRLSKIAAILPLLLSVVCVQCIREPKSPMNAGIRFLRSVEHQEDVCLKQWSKEKLQTDVFRKRWGLALARNRQKQIPETRKQKPLSDDSLEFYVRVGLAGGFGGAMGTAVLYPADSAKTLRQCNPDRYRSVRHAFRCLIFTTRQSVSSAVTSVQRQWHIQRAYAGLLPSVLGALPSSALYFGAYEGMKHAITKFSPEPKDSAGRLWVHALSAASGNVLSSAVFVPKEAIKQQMQYQQTSNIGKVCFTILRKRGITGLYSGYRATLLRNIPSAMLRFAIYEELKFRWSGKDDFASTSAFSWKLFLAGAAAGSLASGFMTPVDVIKTKISTGSCPIDLSGCANQILIEQGWKGFYLGAGSRMLWSGAFSSIGFGSFEAAKKWLGVSETKHHQQETTKSKAKP